MAGKKQEKQQELIDKLKDIPKVKDTRNKEEIYNQISSRLNNSERKSGKNKILIPLASVAAAALLFIIFMPVFFGTDMQQTSDEGAQNQASDMEMEQGNENSAIQYDQESSEGGTNEESSLMEQETSVEDENESLVIQDTHDNENLYFAGLSDIQEQYVIPITFITSVERDLQTFYNNMEMHLNKWEGNTGEYLFENVEFQINQAENEVTLELSEEFSLSGGSARANMFENILTTMFRPYGTDKVTIQTEDGEPVKLDPFGEIDEMSLQQISPSSYKLYEMEDIKMLIRIPNDEQTGVEEAIMKLKEDEKEFHVYKTVPDDIQFTIEAENKQLNIMLTGDTFPREEQDSLQMIEAILMTAKSYGYEQVRFDYTEQEYIGPYDLTEPVPVPEAVNPIYLDD